MSIDLAWKRGVLVSLLAACRMTCRSRSLPKIRRIYCGCAGFGQIFRSFSLNRPHYSPQTIETSDSNQHTLATIANLGQAPSKLWRPPDAHGRPRRPRGDRQDPCPSGVAHQSPAPRLQSPRHPRRPRHFQHVGNGGVGGGCGGERCSVEVEKVGSVIHWKKLPQCYNQGVAF